MDPDIAAAFRASTSVSGKLKILILNLWFLFRFFTNKRMFYILVVKGNSSHLMKISAKRRRTKAEIDQS